MHQAYWATKYNVLEALPAVYDPIWGRNRDKDAARLRVLNHVGVRNYVRANVSAHDALVRLFAEGLTNQFSVKGTAQDAFRVIDRMVEQHTPRAAWTMFWCVEDTKMHFAFALAEDAVLVRLWLP